MAKRDQGDRRLVFAKSPDGAANPRRHLPALDGLRGAAVVAVLLFHAGNLTGGWLGVDLFFVLSGFLITSLLLAERSDRGTISLSAFWSRRARRLLPALLLLLIGIGIYAVIWAAPRELGQIRSDALATLGYIANWHQIAQGHSYWSLFRAPSPLEHTWSLGIEEQFYLVWPLLVVGLLAWRRSNRAVLAASVVGVLASFGIMVLLYAPGSDPQRVYLGTDTRASSVLLGAGLAALVAMCGWTQRRTRRIAIEALGVVGVGFLAWAWLHLSGTTPAVYEGLLLACSLAAVCVIAAAAHPNGGPVARALSFRPLCAIGLISYGLYLWHWPVYLVVDSQRVGVNGWMLTGTRVAITLGFALVSYILVERPIRRGALAGWRIRTLTPAAVALTAAVVVVATMQPSAPHTNPGSALRHLLAAAGPNPAPVVPKTVPASTTQPFRLLVTGDSVAFRLLPAFREFEGPFRYSVIARTTFGCALERGVTASQVAGGGAPISTPNCAANWGEAANERPDVVFVSLAGQIGGEWQIAGHWVHPCDAAYDSWYERQVIAGLETLTSHGARVALALAAPSPFGEPLLRTECVRADLTRAARFVPGVTPIDFKLLVCPRNQCVNQIDGITLREDGMHYLGPAAELVVRWLGPRLQSLAVAAPSRG
jgi:peptidoglycan/LPS O-acetylase OafA/YrhL